LYLSISIPSSRIWSRFLTRIFPATALCSLFSSFSFFSSFSCSLPLEEDPSPSSLLVLLLLLAEEALPERLDVLVCNDDNRVRLEFAEPLGCNHCVLKPERPDMRERLALGVLGEAEPVRLVVAAICCFSSIQTFVFSIPVMFLTSPVTIFYTRL